MTDEEVFARVNETRSLLKTIEHMKRNWIFSDLKVIRMML